MACVFCDIISGEAEASFVYQGPLVVSFLTIRPVTAGHLLVVPKEHYESLREIDEPLGAEMFSVARLMSQALRQSGLRCDGVDLFLTDGEAAGQSVFHTHLHVFPRYIGDRFAFDIDWGAAPDRGELDDNAAAIREAVASFD